MARITYVQKAQQRYETVPVRNEDGSIKQTPVKNADGTQKTTKSGRPVFLTVTVADRSKPLPLNDCDYCHEPIQVGTPYKHISPKSGPYGGRQLNRHDGCPSWQVWDYSNSLSARTARIAYDFTTALNSAETPEDVTSALEEAASAVREIAEEKRASAQNIEDGFGHETEQSSELNDVADQLDSWADDIEAADVPDLPEPEETDCDECDGTGEVEGEDVVGNPITDAMCETCAGSGQVTPEEPSEDQIAEWRGEARDACAVVDECPV